MAEEIVEKIVETPVKETAPVLEETTEIVPETEEVIVETPVEEVKTFTQDDFDSEIGKRLARQERKLKREWEQKNAQPEQGSSDLKIDQFATPEEYAEALADQKLEQRDQIRSERQIVEAYQDREEDARERYPDFEQVAYNQNVRITDAMAHVIRSADNGPDIAYHLGSNPKEAARISALHPLLQASEIGTIKDTLLNKPVAKKQSSAPAPITPIGGNKGGEKSVADMSDDEYRANRRQRVKTLRY